MPHVTSANGAAPGVPERRLLGFLWLATLLWLAALGGLLVLFAVVGEDAWPVLLLLYLPRHPWVIPGLALLPFALRPGRRALLLPLGLGALVWLFALMGFVPPHRSPPAGGPTLRVLSYNTTHALDGAEGLRSLILETRPDLVLFQWTSHLADEAMSGPGFEGWTILRAAQFTVASRFPILSIEAVGYPSGAGPPCAHAILETPLGTLDVYSIRPQSARREIGATHRRGVWERLRELVQDTRSERVSEMTSFREAQTRSIAVEAAKAQHLALIAGDSNLPDGSLFLRRYLGRYRDAFVESGWGFGYTYPARLPWMRLDRVLMGPGLGAVAFDVLPRRVASHRAVLVEIARVPAS